MPAGCTRHVVLVPRDLPVEVTVPVVDLGGSHAHAQGQLRSRTAQVLPASVFVVVMVVAGHPCHHVVGAALEVEGLVVVVDAAGPVAVTEFHRTFTPDLPHAILMMVIVLTCDLIDSRAAGTDDVERLVIAIVPSRHSLSNSQKEEDQRK